MPLTRIHYDSKLRRRRFDIGVLVSKEPATVRRLRSVSRAEVCYAAAVIPDKSRVGFGADVSWAARALVRQPSVVLVSVAVALLPDAPTADESSGVNTALGEVVRCVGILFMLGWFGAQRVFFQRQSAGGPVSLRHLVGLVPAFVGRFLALGAWCALTFMAIFFPAGRLLGIDFTRDAAEFTTPIPLVIIYVAFGFLLDFGLTFVTPALAFTTRSAWHALGIGIAMIRQTWPRCILYVLCPPLALTLLSHLIPIGGIPSQLILTFILAVMGLVAKGAIAVFYLRERGSYSDDGAAYG